MMVYLVRSAPLEDQVVMEPREKLANPVPRV